MALLLHWVLIVFLGLAGIYSLLLGGFYSTSVAAHIICSLGSH